MTYHTRTADLSLGFHMDLGYTDFDLGCTGSHIDFVLDYTGSHTGFVLDYTGSHTDFALGYTGFALGYTGFVLVPDHIGPDSGTRLERRNPECYWDAG